MNTSTKRSSSFLLYLPFLAFEVGALAIYLGCAFFKSSYIQEKYTQQITALVVVWLLSAVLSKFYYYERNLTYTKQLQRFFVFAVSWAVLFTLVKVTALALFTVKAKTVFGFLIVLFLSKAISLSSLFRLRKKALRFQQNILVYSSETGKRFVQDVLQLKRTGYSICEVEKGTFEKKSAEDLKTSIQKHHIKTIFMPVEVALKKSYEHILDLSWNKEVGVELIADYNLPIAGKGARNFGLTQAVVYEVSPLDVAIKRILKRIFDVFFSSLVILLFLSWVIPIVGLFILLDSKGPLFFLQNRPGRHSKPFKCFKLRSMTVNRNTEESASRNDVRITRVGKFIRRTSIDELPQFFNVLLGQMSIVGPRPNLMSQNNHYTQIFDEYHKRMYLKPGITGLAQVSGARGGIEDDIDMKHRVKYDIFYIRNWSFALDIKIIIRTVLNIIRGEEKAY